LIVEVKGRVIKIENIGMAREKQAFKPRRGPWPQFLFYPQAVRPRPKPKKRQDLPKSRGVAH